MITNFLFFIFFIFIISSIRHHSKQKKFLTKKLAIDTKIDKKFRTKFGIPETTVLGVTLFDVLYNLGKLDTFALKGIDHLHNKQNFESLADIQNYLRENIPTDKTLDTVYKGHTGEWESFDYFRNLGYDVTVNPNPAEKGYDAIINGDKVDVATSSDVNYIQRKLDETPEDIKIVVPKDVEQFFVDNDRIIVNPNLNPETTLSHTAETVEGLSDLGNFIDSIPVLTLGVSAIKNGVSVSKGNKTVSDAIEHTALDTAGVGLGGYVGSKIGLAIGLAFAPVTGGTSAVVIPAASSLIGSLIGILTGKGIFNYFKERHLRGYIEDLNSNSSKFSKSFIKKFDILIEKLKNINSEQKNKFKTALKDMENLFKRLFFPSVMSKFYSMSIYQLGEDQTNAIEFYNKLLDTVKRKKAEERGLIIYGHGKGILLEDQDLVNYWDKINILIDKINKEKKRLS